MRRLQPFFVGLLSLSWAAPAAEFWVDQSAATGGDGSAGKPFQTISQAVSAAGNGDTVTVRNGVYREQVSLKSGRPGQPFTLRASAGAEGTNVVLSSFRPVTNWQAFSSQVFTTAVSWVARDLYVGFAPQRLARSPNIDQPWSRVGAFNAAWTQITPSNGAAAAITGTGGFVFGLASSLNGEVTLPVAATDPTANTITLASSNNPVTQLRPGDRFMLCNDPALIDQPGEWAYQALSGGSTLLYLWPAQTNDLRQTQSARQVTPLTINNGSNVCVQGLEIAGGYNGISVTSSKWVAISNCVVHDVSGGAGNVWGIGIHVRTCADVVVTRCRTIRNHFGLDVLGSRKVLVQENEIAFNREDGLRVVGDPNQALPEFRYSDDVVVRRNYLHHHLYLGHPDNMQIFSGVHRLRCEDNVSLFGGQGLMTQENSQDNQVVGNVMLGMAANVFQVHTGDSRHWGFWRNLIGFGGWSGLTEGRYDFRVYENIIYHNSLSTDFEHQGDRNLVWPGLATGNAVVVASNGVWKAGYASLSNFTAVSKQERHSVQADPRLLNVPLDQGLAVNLDSADCTSSDLHVRRQGSLTGAIIPFAAGDFIEVNGDGVPRQVSAVTGDRISFAPPLPVRPFREAESTLIWRWGMNTNFHLDTRPSPTGPAANLSVRGGPAGSTLIVTDFQAGDFNGDGVRELPAVPAALQAAWPDPNHIVIPYWSPL